MIKYIRGSEKNSKVMSKNIDLSIIIVNYNTLGLLRNLLLSLGKSNHNHFKLETIIIDNGSQEKGLVGLKKEFPKIKIIFSSTNLGYAKANNLGIRKSQGRYLLFLNSDTLLEEDTLSKMISFLDQHPEYSAATCKVELPNKKLDPACHRGFPTPWAAFSYFIFLENLFPKSKLFGQYHQTWKDLTKVHPVDVISGCFFLIRQEVIKKIGLFDERFFLYAEDIDLCLRLKNSGHKIIFFPETKITHIKTSSGRKNFKGNKITQKDKNIRKKAKKHFYETMKLYYDKHYKEKYPWIVRNLVLAGIKVVSQFKD